MDDFFITSAPLSSERPFSWTLSEPENGEQEPIQACGVLQECLHNDVIIGHVLSRADKGQPYSSRSRLDRRLVYNGYQIGRDRLLAVAAVFGWGEMLEGLFCVVLSRTSTYLDSFVRSEISRVVVVGELKYSMVEIRRDFSCRWRHGGDSN